MKRACILHDRANLLCLPMLVSLAVAGLCGAVDPGVFSWFIFFYVALDTIWILLQPDAVPAALTAIRVHHFVTLLLCVFPLLRKETAIFACLDGLTELNTFFLIARRQWKAQRGLLTAAYWATFVPVRLMLFPYLLIVFGTRLPQSIPIWERHVIWYCQAFLCVFNLGMVHRSLSGWWRKRRHQHWHKVAPAPRSSPPEPLGSGQTWPPQRAQSARRSRDAGGAASGSAATATAHIVLRSRQNGVKNGFGQEKYTAQAADGARINISASRGLLS